MLSPVRANDGMGDEPFCALALPAMMKVAAVPLSMPRRENCRVRSMIESLLDSGMLRVNWRRRPYDMMRVIRRADQDSGQAVKPSHAAAIAYSVCRAPRTRLEPFYLGRSVFLPRSRLQPFSLRTSSAS